MLCYVMNVVDTYAWTVKVCIIIAVQINLLVCNKAVVAEVLVGLTIEALVGTSVGASFGSTVGALVGALFGLTVGASIGASFGSKTEAI